MNSDRAIWIAFILGCQVSSAFFGGPSSHATLGSRTSSRRLVPDAVKLHQCSKQSYTLKTVLRRQTQLSVRLPGFDEEEEDEYSRIPDDFVDDFDEPILDADKILGLGRGPMFGDLVGKDDNDDDDDDPVPLTTKVGVVVATLLLFLPRFGTMMASFFSGGGAAPGSIGDTAVITQQDAPQRLVTANNAKFKLSRAKIQEKLSGLPVFYIASSDGSMQEEIFTSYSDAASAARGGTVKVTTLDQVLYPLIMKRGRLGMEPPPTEIRRAEERLFEDSNAASFQLVPSKTAMQDAKALNMVVPSGDLPLFLAKKLAFQSDKGPLLPLFLEQRDAVTSYNRLREVDPTLPEKPVIQSLTLLDEIKLMEAGRPGVDKVVFYSTSEDLDQAVKMYEKQEGMLPKYADEI